MDFLAPLLYVVVTANIVLSVIILSRGLQKINSLFGILALTTALWGFAITGFYTKLPELIRWVSLTHASALLIALTFFLFSTQFPSPKKSHLTIPFLILFFVSCLFLFGTNQIVDTGVGVNYHVAPVGYFLYSLLLSSYFVGGFYFLYQQLQDSDPIQKKQVSYVFVGALSSTTLATITDLVFPFFGNFEFTWLGPVFTAILVISIFLAIIRHHLFDIKVIATELFTFSLWFASLGQWLVAESTTSAAVSAALFLLSIVVGVFLIKSVIREVQQRERIEKLAKELETANERLKDLDRQKSEFVSIASHQLRSPLTAIKGYASLVLENSYGPVTDKVRMAVDRIFQSSQSLVIVIENFLNISRIEQGRMRYDFAPVELSNLTQQIVNQLLPNAEKKGLKISYISKTQPPVNVQADADKLRQVILNFVDNSIKYTPAGSIEVTLEMLPSGHPRIVVSDTGIGMKKETIETLFQKFSRAEGASKVNAGGAGLGLFLASEIMKAHHGSVRAESDGLGKGSRFIIEFGA